MDLHPQQLLEILDKSCVIHQTPARLPGYQQIEVAVLCGFTAGNGAEHAQAVGAALLGEAEDRLPPFRAQCVERDHASIVRQWRPNSASTVNHPGWRRSNPDRCGSSSSAPWSLPVPFPGWRLPPKPCVTKVLNRR